MRQEELLRVLDKVFASSFDVHLFQESSSSFNIRVVHDHGGDCILINVTFYRKDAPVIRLISLSKCVSGGVALSGKTLLSLVDEFAEGICARRIELGDAASINIGSEEAGRCSIPYSAFLVLATGKSYYAQFGYTTADNAYQEKTNMELINKPFGKTLRELNAETSTITDIDHFMGATLPAFLSLGGFTYENTTKEIFAEIRRSGIVHRLTDCADPVVSWLNTVITVFSHRLELPQMNMVKTVNATCSKGGGSKRSSKRSSRHTRRTSQKCRKATRRVLA